ncbi:prepilin peptidase [Vibrio scophthalmi]|uniref:prepilin peptidase n=1 Tax=Vibrio scophthalmi TaxID=45658 RepID=UPI0022843DB2|nr:prepilin peptidase [Vibrio scophthalmi]
MGWLLLVILSCYVSFQDITRRIIPNKSCGLIFLITIYLAFVSRSWMYDWDTFIGICFLLFLYFISFWGGGDTKLAIVFLPAISTQYVLLFLVGIGLLGGVLVLVYMMVGLIRRTDTIKTSGLPFGIPICVSGLFCVTASI